MDIAFITPSISRAAGGIFEIERRLGQCLDEIPNTNVAVFGLKDEHAAADLPAWQPLRPAVFAISGPRGFGYSSALQRAVNEQQPDVAHLHALWMFPSVVIHEWGKRKKRPYLVTPNGMLEPWALNNSKWKKRIAALLYERRMLEDAGCLQANTKKEAADIRAFGLKNPIAIIPNGMDVPERVEKVSVSSVQRPNHEQVLLYLGRIHPKKGLASLIKAWAGLQKEARDWQLQIAGWDEGGHEAELKKLATELRVPWSDSRIESAVTNHESQLPITSHFSPLTSHAAKASTPANHSPITIHQSRSALLFTGPRFGAEKDAILREADAFILPSLSEGLPMSVLEAWAYQLPVLMTPECNLPEGFAADAAIQVDKQKIDGSLRRLFLLTDDERLIMGQQGRKLVQERFAWPQIAAQMREVYAWVLGEGPRPNCVEVV